MLNIEKDGLYIFQPGYFMVDKALKQKKEAKLPGDPFSGLADDMSMPSSMNPGMHAIDMAYWEGIPKPAQRAYHLRIFRKYEEWRTGLRPGGNKIKRLWFKLLLKLLPSSGGGRRNKVGLRPEEFFLEVKTSPSQLKKVGKRLDSFEKLIADAKANGQESLAELVLSKADILGRESKLYGLGLVKYIDELDLVNIVKNAKEGFRLDWIKSFIRIIPLDVVSKKKKCDSIYIFDNYVILHFDPEGKSFALTAEEKKEKEDPILFGVMKGSKRLYFVGDWIDIYCNLSLESLIDKYGATENLITSEIDLEKDIINR